MVCASRKSTRNSVVVLHGGPGAGCSTLDAEFFDLKYWRVILFDQRGAKRSLPFAEMKDNTLPHLISDLERLESHCISNNGCYLGAPGAVRLRWPMDKLILFVS